MGLFDKVKRTVKKAANPTALASGLGKKIGLIGGGGGRVRKPSVGSQAAVEAAKKKYGAASLGAFNASAARRRLVLEKAVLGRTRRAGRGEMDSGPRNLGAAVERARDLKYGIKRKKGKISLQPRPKLGKKVKGLGPQVDWRARERGIAGKKKGQ